METMIKRMKAAAERRAAYSRTVREIEGMPLCVADDLGINRADARRIAREAVYG